ncbi:methionine--tRNA ligase [Saccharothrix sp. NRRL B-16314]|uniref:methionine--tRNA ligase n=1 Tax=Saccharothrix sp. NRRL B-16314 TaxID=1463825 RepID=UPI0005275179|nr:methionine--tRNA ligase [Saccharothrix sp. NRRL B-16314]
MSRFYVTTAIPDVDAGPHLGYALEVVQADVLARHHRLRGDRVRFLTGIDENSSKNVPAAEEAGLSTGELVDRNAAAFAALREPLALSFSDFIRTSRDARHRSGVERLWRACADAGDIYRAHCEGLYCVGCEQFRTSDELVDGKCPEHDVAPRFVTEENWFFRLSRYADRLHDLISGGTIRVEPASRRDEVLGFIAAGLRDFAISRSRTRAHDWGIPVPGDPDQVVQVWWDALGTSVTSLGYGEGRSNYRRWWVENDRRVHVIGKDVLRFHAVLWPAVLLSAGEPVPTDVLVHDHLTTDGRRLGKSAGDVVDPVGLADRYGADAVRWWLLREVPRVGDAHFTVPRLVARANEDLATGLGTLVNRVTVMAHRYRDGRPPVGAGPDSDAEPLGVACRECPDLVHAALTDFDFGRAAAAVWRIVEEANRYVEHVRPWELARAERGGDVGAGRRLDSAITALLSACRVLATELTPFIPTLAARISGQCVTLSDRLPLPQPLFPRL